MKNKLIILFLLLNFSGFSQIVRTLSNVSNTTDTLKPISNAQKSAINNKLQTVSSVSALQSFTDANIAQLDGSTWEKKSGNVTSNGGSYAGTLIRVSSTVYWERKVEKDFSPEWFGAVGDGTTNDITALNLCASATAVAKKNLLLTKIYAISDNIIIKNGVKKVYGGGTIKSLASTNDGAGLYLAGKSSGYAENVSFCTVENLIFDSNNQNSSVAMIRMNGASNCVIQNNVVKNITNNYGILLQTTSNSVDECINNIVSNNIINCSVSYDVNGNATRGIAVVSDFTITPYSDAITQWKTTFTPPPTTIKSNHNTIINNSITGGYYGILISCSDYNTVSNNYISNNIRNMSVANVSLNNTITDNNFINCYSTCVSFSYSSSFNTFGRNKVTSSISVGESILQAYVNSKSNLFIDNVINITTTSPEYILYTAIHCNDNKFVKNLIYANPSKGFIGVESAWKSSISNTLHSRYQKGSEVNFFANTGSSGVVISENKCYGTSTSGSFIVLSQVSDFNNNYPLTNITVESNYFDGTALYQLYFIEESGNLTSLQLMNNNFKSQATKTEFVLPRYRSHFTEISGNARLDKGSYYENLTGATPDVSTSCNYSLANSSATNLTNFTGGIVGQKIKVRLDANTTIINNSSYIRTKNATNVTGGSNNFIEFENIGGIWFEVNRNF